jgi:hypothetical protein
VVRAWLAEDAWARSRDFFAEPENEAILTSDTGRAALRAMIAVDPGSDRLRVHAALLDLAHLHRIDDAYAYLTAIGRGDRERLLIEQARGARHAEALAAFGDLVAGIDVRFAQEEDVLSERAYGKLLRAISLVFKGNLGGANDLATEARRHLDGSATAEWVVVLGRLIRDQPNLKAALWPIQLIIVDCDSRPGRQRRPIGLRNTRSPDASVSG